MTEARGLLDARSFTYEYEQGYDPVVLFQVVDKGNFEHNKDGQ